MTQLLAIQCQICSRALVPKWPVMHLVTVFMTRQRFVTLRCGCLHPSRAVHVQKKLPHDKLQDGTSTMPEEQSRLSCCKSRHAFSLRQMAGPKSQSPQARASFELSTYCKYPGGSRKESTLHWSQVATSSFWFNCTESNSSSEKRARTITSFVARPCESFARTHSNDELQCT